MWSLIDQITALLGIPCLLCGHHHHQPVNICQACLTDLPWCQQSCRQCGLPLATEPGSRLQLVCGQCLQQPPMFNRSLAACHYLPPVDGLLKRFKHQHHLPSGRVLAHLLAQAVKTHWQQPSSFQPELLLPVPLHRQRLQQRGFNQALLLAQWLGTALDLPVAGQYCQRVNRTVSQQGQKRHQRLRNLKGAFQLYQPIRVSRIALVDDVMTTGATVEALSLAIHDTCGNGVEQIAVWCAARTLPPGHQMVW
jgi:ComF family protein